MCVRILADGFFIILFFLDELKCAEKKSKNGKVLGPGLSLSMNRRLWLFTSMLL